MKNIHEIFNRFHLLSRLMIVIMIGSLGFLGACSSDDDDTGIVDTSGVSAFNFTADNTRIAAEIAAAAMEFFPTFNEVGLAMIDTLLNGDPLESPFPDVIPCTNAPTGSTSLSWTDTDSSGDLTVGDTARLTFTACDIPDDSGEIISGTVDFKATSVEVPVSIGPLILGIDVSLDLTITLGADTTTVAGDFGFTMSTTDMVNFTNVYVAVDALGQAITITENGIPYFKAGCFNVTQKYTMVGVQNDMYDLAPLGAINASNQVLSLAGGPDLMFIDGEMYAGTQRLLSISAPDCASIGAPDGVPDSDGSYMDMEAITSGLMVLHTFDKDDFEFHTEETSWTALTD
jgi:hypothetical protein